MLKCVKAMAVFAFLIGMPAAAFAQASIVGTVRDAQGGVVPGVTVEASSPGAHREDAVGHHERDRSVHDRKPAARHLHGDVHAVRVQRREARGHRADRHVHRDGERGNESRWRGRNDHGQRRSAGGGRDERAHRADAQQRDDTEHSIVSTVLLVHTTCPGNQRPGQRRGRRQCRSFQCVPGPRRTPERGSGSRGRHERRLSGYGRVVLRAGYRQLAGSGVQHQRRTRRGDDRRSADEHCREAGRQHVRRELFHQRDRQRASGRPISRRRFRRRG